MKEDEVDITLQAMISQQLQIQKDPLALAIIRQGERLVTDVNAAERLGVDQNTEGDLLTLLAGSRLTQELAWQREHEKQYGVPSAGGIIRKIREIFIPQLRDPSPSERLVVDFTQSAEQLLADQLGPDRTWNLKMAVHNLITGGLTAGEQISAGNNVEGFDVEEWGKTWRTRLKSTPPIQGDIFADED